MPTGGRLLTAVGLIVVGLIICWISIGNPLAKAHVQRITYSLKGAFAGPVIVFFGVAAFFSREAIGFGRGQKPTVLGWMILVLGLDVGGLTAWWMHSELARLGYGQR